MKKYIKPAIEVVELSVKESLSDLPQGFSRSVRKNVTTSLGSRTVTIYKSTSVTRTV